MAQNPYTKEGLISLLELLEKTQDTNLRLVQLLDRQHEIIRELQKQQISSKNRPSTAGLQTSPSNPDLKHSIGPSSERLLWTGGPTDLIPLEIDGKEAQGIVLTKEMIQQWNELLSLTPKIETFQEEFRRLRQAKERYEEIFKSAKPIITKNGKMYEGLEEDVLKDYLRWSKNGAEWLFENIAEAEREKRDVELGLFRTMRIILEKGKLDGFDWTSWQKELENQQKEDYSKVYLLLRPSSMREAMHDSRAWTEFMEFDPDSAET